LKHLLLKQPNKLIINH